MLKRKTNKVLRQTSKLKFRTFKTGKNNSFVKAKDFTVYNGKCFIVYRSKHPIQKKKNNLNGDPPGFEKK